MGETTADVRHDIELTRARMSTTLAELERKLNVVHVVRDHPWASLALAFGAGVALSASGADVKSAAATVGATKGARSRVGGALDGFVASLLSGVTLALNDKVEGWVGEIESAIGAPRAPRGRGRPSRVDGYGVGPGASPIAGTPAERGD